MGELLKGYLQVKCAGQNRLSRKAWRKRWLVMEFPGSMGGETTGGDSPTAINTVQSVLVRVYSSHVHENRGPPLFSVQVLEVHALHRIQSRSQPYAFSIDGSSGELVAAGRSETDTQHWIKSIRSRIWQITTNNRNRKQVGYPVSLIDNVHSDVARLRGFYGNLEIDRTAGEIVLVEERSGEEQVRWALDTINRVFCPKTISKKDRDKILVIITKRRSKSIGQGIFTFFSNQAQDIHGDIQYSTRICAERKKGSYQSDAKGRTGSKINPLSFLFSKNSSQQEGGMTTSNSYRNLESRQEKNRRRVLEKSKSMIEKFGYREATADDLQVPSGLVQQDQRFEEVNNPDQRPEAAAGSDHVGPDRPQQQHQQKREAASPSPPPFPSPPEDQPISNLLQEGHYYRFDKAGDEQKYDVINLKDDDNMDDALIKLQNIERSLLELSQQSHLNPQHDIRLSYISVDSGRSSDTYAETSASSIASSSSTNHSNRLNSNASNCSADSGTETAGADNSTQHPGGTAPHLHAQQINSAQHPSINVSGSLLGTSERKPLPPIPVEESRGYQSLSRSISMYQQTQGSESIYCCTKNSKTGGGSGPNSGPGSAPPPTAGQLKDLQIYACLQRRQERKRSKDFAADGCNTGGSGQTTPRFATIRKSHTLPHNINSYQEDTVSTGSTINSNYNSSTMNNTYNNSASSNYSNNDYATFKIRPDGGCSGAAVCELVTPDQIQKASTPVDDQRLTSRPASLRLELQQIPGGRRFVRSGSTEDGAGSQYCRVGFQQPAQNPLYGTLGPNKQQHPGSQQSNNTYSVGGALNRKLEKLKIGGSGSIDPISAPSTPLESIRCFVPATSIPEHSPYNDSPAHFPSQFKGSVYASGGIFNSTPENLDFYNRDYCRIQYGWQSSDGLTTPVSLSGRSPIHTPASLSGLSPAHTPNHTFSPFQTPAKTPNKDGVSPGQLFTSSMPSGYSTIGNPGGGGQAHQARSTRLKRSFRGSDSMYSLRTSSSPRRPPGHCVSPAGRGGGVSTCPRGGGTNTTSRRRFHSIPRSSTIHAMASTNQSLASLNSSCDVIPPGTEMPPNLEGSSHYASSSKSLDNLLKEGQPQETQENIYMEMRKHPAMESTNITSHYLDMDKGKQQK